MRFLMDNYIWFLVAGVVGLMTVIGYIAEQTDFGRKEVKRNESKEKKVKKDVKKLEGSKLNDVVYNDNNKNIEIVNINELKENDFNIEEDLTVPLNNQKEEVIINNFIDEDLTVPLNGKKEELKQEFNIEEDLTVPLNNKNIKKEEIVGNLEKTQNESVEINSADDIWKF